MLCIPPGYWQSKILKAKYNRKDINILGAEKITYIKEVHPLPIKSTILSFEPLPTRGLSVTQK